MSRVILHDIAVCKKSDLRTGVYLVIFHANRVPPHIGMFSSGRYYSLTATESQIGINIDSIWRTITSKEIETLFVQINSSPSESLLTSIYSSYKTARAYQFTCLRPIKDFFHIHHGMSMDNVQFIFDLIPALRSANLVEKTYHLNLKFPVYENFFELLQYDMVDVYQRIEELQNESTHV